MQMPIELWANDEKVATFMGSPYDLDDLAVGHLITRGIIKSLDLIEKIEINSETYQIFVTSKEALSKSLYSVPEFVLSGTSSVDKFNDNIYKIAKVDGNFTVELEKIIKFANIMVDDALIYHTTGGVHSSIVVDGATDKHYLREDIGRHCAVDKAIGAAIKDGVDLSRSFICTSGRISLDMLLKSAAVGLPIVASLKYPSDMGVRLANHYDTSIVARVLSKNPLVYANKERVKHFKKEEL